MAQNSLIPAAPGVRLIRLSWSNAYALGDGADFILIDAGTPHDKIALARALPPSSAARCRALWLSHAHPDHAGSAAFVARRFDAPVVAHEDERPFIESGRLYAPPREVQRAAFQAGSLIWPVRPCRLSRALSGGEVLESPAGDWLVVHTPGHTLGHVSFFRERDGVLIAGDALLNVLPWTRRTGLTLPLRLFTENSEQAMESARALARLRPRVLLAGHGEPLLDAAGPLWKFAFG